LATVVSHLAVPLALTMAIGSGLIPQQLTALAVVCSVLPDLDALGLWFGIPYAHTFGHRGITHSLPFGVAVAGLGFAFASQLDCQPWVVFLVLLVSTLSHGLLDALTNGGLGVAFFSPSVADPGGVAAWPVGVTFASRLIGAHVRSALRLVSLPVGRVCGYCCTQTIRRGLM
jgi:membrane-bound metal-dependent hydrolase YbcI (DUF457 family)